MPSRVPRPTIVLDLRMAGPHPHGIARYASLLAQHLPESGPLRLAGWLMLAGIVLFSGSLYVLALSGMRWLGALTPFGGACFILGWLALAYAVLRA